MSFHWYMVTVMLLLCVFKSSECRYKNISCKSIQTSRGYVFLFDCAAGTEIYAYYNQTVIAFAKPQKQSYIHSPDVISMDNSSIITRHCRDLRMQCIRLNGKYVWETWEEFKITEALDPDASDVTARWDLIIIVSPVMIMALGIAGMIYCCWKKKHTVRLQSSCCAREEISQLSIEISPLSPHGSGNNDVNGNEQDAPTKPVHAHSGDASDLDDGRTFHRQAMNGNLRDDPGGEHAVRTITTHDGGTGGARGPEGRPLLPDQRAAAHGSDVTGEMASLVNKHCFDPHQVSRSSTALDNDAESHPK